jgi:hypothetical protein
MQFSPTTAFVISVFFLSPKTFSMNRQTGAVNHNVKRPFALEVTSYDWR